MDCSLPSSSVHGILQIRTLEWVTMTFSRGSSQPRDQTRVSCIAGRFFTNRAIRQFPPLPLYSINCMCGKLLLSCQSCPTLCDPMDLARQAPLSMGFSRQEHWSGLPCPPPGDFPDSGIKPRSPALQADSLPSESPGMSILLFRRR